MDDVLPDVPETGIDNEIVADVETHVSVEPSGDTDIHVDVAPPENPPLSEVETVEESPLPNEDAEIETESTSDVTSAEEPVTVASDVAPNSETVKETEREVKRTPDTRPKRRLGWRAYILGGSGGTK